MQAIARANRVNEGKNNGLIVDYCGVLRHLRQGAGDVRRTRPGDGGGMAERSTPRDPNEELLADLAEAIAMVRGFLDEGGAPLDDVIRRRASPATPPSLPARRPRTRTTRPASVSRCMCREVFKRSSGRASTCSGVNDPPGKDRERHRHRLPEPATGPGAGRHQRHHPQAARGGGRGDRGPAGAAGRRDGALRTGNRLIHLRAFPLPPPRQFISGVTSIRTTDRN